MSTRYRWFVVFTFFLFILLHQADKLLIGPLTTPIMEAFRINEAQMGWVFTGALIVGAVCYWLWGWLYDRFVRTRLLALASLLWGATTWLSAIVRTFPGFIATRAATGIDDSSYPGLYNVVADYFEPQKRGRVNGLMELAMPLGYLGGMVLALTMQQSVGWRGVFFITGSLGVALSVLIWFGVREPKRGGSEPELRGIEQKKEYRFSWKEVGGLFKKRSLILIYCQSLFGVFPWQVITLWFFRYLEKERGYSQMQVLLTMGIAIIVLAGGYPIGGTLGDAWFKRNTRGRLLVSAIGVALGAIFLVFTLRTPVANQLQFGLLLGATALFMPFAAPNMVAGVYDVTVPEVRSTANAVFNFFDQIGAALAPLLAGLIAMRSSLGNAILWISVGAWALCFVFQIAASFFMPADVAALRAEMARRAAAEKA
ncbi:MAG: MFS transporter [Spirochaetes bacterium RBG_16_67_19]|nr:MAG: MFS transporter [Spirochaetes bacterium GWB1_66_5]OHD76512.1 MAG: MFS transporter [Spirochaetes bacterium RBG_16_67_19]